MKIYTLIMVVIAPSIVGLSNYLLIFFHVFSSTRRTHTAVPAISTLAPDVNPHPRTRMNPRDRHLLQHVLVMFSIFVGGWTPVFLLSIVSPDFSFDTMGISLTALLTQLSLLCIVIDLFVFNHELSKTLKHILLHCSLRESWYSAFSIKNKCSSRMSIHRGKHRKESPFYKSDEGRRFDHLPLWSSTDAKIIKVAHICLHFEVAGWTRIQLIKNTTSPPMEVLISFDHFSHIKYTEMTPACWRRDRMDAFHPLTTTCYQALNNKLDDSSSQTWTTYQQIGSSLHLLSIY